MVFAVFVLLLMCQPKAISVARLAGVLITPVETSW